MRLRNVALVSSAFVLFGIILLVVGAAMLILSTRYINPNNTHATVLRISGRISCVTGGILVVSTLSTCLYLCIIGAQYNITYRPDYPIGFVGGGGSQLTKVMQSIPIRARTNLSTTTTHSHKWPVNEKIYTSQNLARPVYPTGFLPSGDIMDLKRDSRHGEFGKKPLKMSLAPLDSCNWSNSVQPPCPQSGSLRRGRSADPTHRGLSYISTLRSQRTTALMNSLDFNLDVQSPRRIWMPNLNNQNTSTFTQASCTEYGTSHLIGLALEPLGTMLYTGGRVKLGTNT